MLRILSSIGVCLLLVLLPVKAYGAGGCCELSDGTCSLMDEVTCDNYGFTWRAGMHCDTETLTCQDGKELAPIDFVISSCDWVDAGPDDIELQFNYDMVAAPEYDLVGFSVPIRILFNGEPVEEEDHTIDAVETKNMNQCPAPANNACTQPNPACGQTQYSFKGIGPTIVPWPCWYTGPADEKCNCNEVEVAVTKVTPRFMFSGTYTIILDPDDLVPEIDEGNNICEVVYTVAPIPTVSEWGLIVMTLLLLTAGTVVIARRRRRPAAA